MLSLFGNGRFLHKTQKVFVRKSMDPGGCLFSRAVMSPATRGRVRWGDDRRRVLVSTSQTRFWGEMGSVRCQGLCWPRLTASHADSPHLSLTTSQKPTASTHTHTPPPPQPTQPQREAATALKAYTREEEERGSWQRKQRHFKAPNPFTEIKGPQEQSQLRPRERERRGSPKKGREKDKRERHRHREGEIVCVLW